jgi:uncharacterized protein
MRIYVKVTPRSGKNEVEKISDAEYKVRVTAAPEKGKANAAVLKILAEFFHIPKSRFDIIGGKSTRIKIIDINAKC